MIMINQTSWDRLPPSAYTVPTSAYEHTFTDNAQVCMQSDLSFIVYLMCQFFDKSYQR